jgi:hypothetical protein
MLRFPDTFWGGFAKGYFWTVAILGPIAAVATIVVILARHP